VLSRDEDNRLGGGLNLRVNVLEVRVEVDCIILVGLVDDTQPDAGDVEIFPPDVVNDTLGGSHDDIGVAGDAFRFLPGGVAASESEDIRTVTAVSPLLHDRAETGRHASHRVSVPGHDNCLNLRLGLANRHEGSQEKMLIPSIDRSGVDYDVPSPGNVAHNSPFEGREEFPDLLSGGLVEVLKAIHTVVL
jgi:hypothetical protein